jgi:uncharacterized protein (DUF58 family)
VTPDASPLANGDGSEDRRRRLAAVLRQVRLLEIRSRHLVTEVLAGQYSSAFRGRGVEFADVREYAPGDDVRTIDWRVTARMDTAYVRRYVEERELTVIFLIDYSASAAFGSRVRTKEELATEVCAVLAMTAVRSNDRVGAVLFTDRVEKFILPKRGKRHALRIIRELLAFQPHGTRTDLAMALDFVNRVLRRRAVVFVVSDWIAADYQQPLEDLARRHDAVAIQLVDARERELPAVGLLTLRDPETGRSRTIDASSRAVAEQLRRRATAFDAALERSLRREGVGHIRLQTDRSYVTSLLSYFQAREHGRRR